MFDTFELMDYNSDAYNFIETVVTVDSHEKLL